MLIKFHLPLVTLTIQTIASKYEHPISTSPRAVPTTPEHIAYSDCQCHWTGYNLWQPSIRWPTNACGRINIGVVNHHDHSAIRRSSKCTAAITVSSTRRTGRHGSGLPAVLCHGYRSLCTDPIYPEPAIIDGSTAASVSAISSSAASSTPAILATVSFNGVWHAGFRSIPIYDASSATNTSTATAAACN